MDSLNDAWLFGPCGFPHSEICGSRDICSSPQLIAACHVLHRRLVPRHSPCALSNLTYLMNISIHLLWFFSRLIIQNTFNEKILNILKTRDLPSFSALLYFLDCKTLFLFVFSLSCYLVFVCSFQGTTFISLS